MKTFLSLTSILSMVISANAATAVTYSGNWPFTVTHSQRSDGTYCLTLTDDGSLGWPHSGYASLQDPFGNEYFTTFQLIGNLLTATAEQPGGSGQNAGLVFVAHAANGVIGKGVYDQVYGGEEIDSGKVAFGAKGGC